MKVKVVDRGAMNNAWGSGGNYTVITKTIEISSICPECGGPRGKPKRLPFYEGGSTYTVDRWDNPCGHIDGYVAVLAEAENG